MKYLNLRDDVKMPSLGFGTWQIEGNNCIEAVCYALETGYTHIDTAQAYNNEEYVGKGIQKAGVNRDSFFLTTKVFREEFKDTKTALNSIEKSLKKLQTDYVDLLLVHWPFPEYSVQQLLEPMLIAKERGYTKTIGVSNFTVSHMEEAKNFTDNQVCLNQVEYHPSLSQKPILDWVRDNNWAMTSYSPLGRGEGINNNILKSIGVEHGKSPAQVCLRWHLQQDNVAAIPKSATKKHIQSNFDISDFDLTQEEMDKISEISKQENRIVNPDFAPVWDNAKKSA